MRFSSWVVLAVLLTLSVATTNAAGQSFQGGLRGEVKDAQGVIPGVTLTLINEATAVSRETVTNEAGEYSFPALIPGSYTVRTSVSGFKTYERKGVRIGTQQFLTLDVLLEIGAVEETVTVTADAPLVETSNASTGDVLDSKTLQSLPNIGRNAFLVSNTVPTVVASGDDHWNRMQDVTGASTVSLGGGGVRANNYLIDGFPITDLENRSTVQPSIEALQDVKVQVHTYDSEMGHTGGGVFNATAKSGTNSFHGSGYFQDRPSALIGENFFLRVQGRPNAPQYWRDGGGGIGGPIVKDKTFFWTSVEAYRDGLTQNGNLTFPTLAERSGNFSGLTDANGNPVILYDPLSTTTNPVTGVSTRTPFPGNIIPSNRINLVGAAIVSYMPLPTVDQDNGSPNYQTLDVLYDKAQQASGKVEHHFNDKVALSGFFLNQVTHEPGNNFNHQNPFASTSYLTNRSINNLVLNNTFVINSSTVLALRYGWNRFFDDDVDADPFNASMLGFNSSFVNAMPIQKFPSIASTGYGSMGEIGPDNKHFHSYGFNGTLTKLTGAHSFKMGADYRQIGVNGIAWGQASGTFGFTGTFTQGPNPVSPSKTTGNAIADLLLGYPATGSEPLSTPINAFTRYYSGYIQDDYRVNSRLTINYGMRLEHQDGLMEENNNFTVGFDQNAINPLNSLVTLPVDPLTGQISQVKGGLIFAGVNGAPTHQGNPPAIEVAPRAGVVFRINDHNVLRGGYGIFYAPWQYPNPGTSSYGQWGYTATTTLQQNTLVPITSVANPFPAGLTQPSGNSLGLLTNTGGDISFIDPNKGVPRVQQYSADLQHELPGNMNVSIGYVGARGDHLGYGGTIDTSININQLDPKYFALGNQLLQLVPNPFFGIPQAGGYASLKTIQYGQLLRPFPEFGNVLMTQSTGARSVYNAAVFELRKPLTGWWGGQFSYTYSRLNDNQFGQSNYYSLAPGLLNNYEVIPASAYYNPDLEYGRSLLDTPHKVVIAPIIQLPFGSGRAHLNKGGPLDYLVGGWTISAVATIQSGFPIGVSQTPNNSNLFGSGQRPNVVSGVSFGTPGSITNRLEANPSDNVYLNPAAFALAPAFTFGNAPRILPGVSSPGRNTTDLAFNKDFKAPGSTTVTMRIEVINLFNNPWYAAFASTAFGASNFGQVTTQANYSRMAQITFRLSY